MSADERALLQPMGAARPRRPLLRSNERRDRLRCEVRIEIDVEGADGPVACVTRNLSDGGMFVVTDLERPLGTQLALALHLNGVKGPIRCTGEVRWIRRGSQAEDAPNGMGVRLVGLDPEVKRRLQTVLWELAPPEEE
ncbi:MAG TPA: TIGR02266 family protein [Polyangiaceae bacterium]|nr:TIGR02266 family protein [Polyangiaceae bacterium]